MSHGIIDRGGGHARWEKLYEAETQNLSYCHHGEDQYDGVTDGHDEPRQWTVGKHSIINITAETCVVSRRTNLRHYLYRLHQHLLQAVLVQAGDPYL
jgi:hypothetical protein